MRYREKTKKELNTELNELLKAYNELYIKEERYRLLIEHARDVIWTQKIDGSITYLSPAVEKLCGFTVEEAMTQPTEKILTPDSIAITANYFQKLTSAFESGLPLESFRGELNYYRKDGTILNSEVIAYPILGSDLSSITILGTTRDITDRKLFETQLLDQAKRLKELNTTKDKFFSIIAHDLKSPFTGILGLSEVLKNEACDLDIDSIIKYSELIYLSTQQTLSLLDNLQDWAKSQQPGFPFSPKKIFINHLITIEIERLKPNADKKNISLVFSKDEEIIITADEKMISTVIRNLISNAIKFTKHNGSVKVEVSMKIDQLEILVSDSGIGMNKESIEKLFKIENSITNPGTENEKGTGLGLIICMEFVKKHGGKILVESEIGKGSKFCISIPLMNCDAK